MAIDHDQPPVYELVEMVKDAPILVLHVNGVQSVCPFQPAIPTLDENRRPVVGRCACTTGCPLAQIEWPGGDQKGSIFKVGCGSHPVSHEVTIKKVSTIRHAGPGLYIPSP